MFVAEVALDMKDITERAMGNQPLKLAHAWKTAFVVAQGERHAGLSYRRDRAICGGAGQCQWLLAPDWLAGGRNGLDLRDVKRMRSCKKHRLDAWVGDSLFEFGRQFETFGRGKVPDKVRFLAYTSDEAKSLALALYRLDDAFSPSPEPYDRCIDHENAGRIV
jgi:hypothetical protein